jgi:hypothetical protein
MSSQMSAVRTPGVPAHSTITATGVGVKALQWILLISLPSVDQDSAKEECQEGHSVLFDGVRRKWNRCGLSVWAANNQS